MKVTTKLGVSHDLSGVYQADRLLLKVVGAEDYEPIEVLSTGGPMYGAKLTSVWGQNVTSTITTSYNTKGGNSLDSYEGRTLTGPLVEYHRGVGQWTLYTNNQFPGFAIMLAVLGFNMVAEGLRDWLDPQLARGPR